MIRSPLDRVAFQTYLRLVPIILITLIIRWNDRNNIALGKLKMIDDLPTFRKYGETIFGLGQTLFAVGGLILPIPATILVEKWSARKWFCILSVIWGILTSLTAFVTQPWHFCVLRFSLGIGGSGYFSAVLIYFSRWFPANGHAKAFSFLFSGIPIAAFINPKISYLFLRMGTTENGISYQTLFGLQGWQWMFIVWGLLSIFVGILTLFFLPDRPSEVNWLTDSERQVLESQKLVQQKNSSSQSTFLQRLFCINSLLMCAVRFFNVTGGHAFTFFMPTILNDWYHLSYAVLTWILLIPSFSTIIFTLLLGWTSDRFGERYFHNIIPFAIVGLVLIISLVNQTSLTLTTYLFTIANIGFVACFPSLWSLCIMLTVEGVFPVESLGLINVFGSLGEVVGPLLISLLKDLTGSFSLGIISMSISTFLAAGFLMILHLRVNRRLKVHMSLPEDDDLTESTKLCNNEIQK